MKTIRNLGTLIGATSLLFAVGCGKVKDEVTEAQNEMRVEGHWLMNGSEHASDLQKFAEKESMVLTFKDGKAAFSPTDSAKGKTVHATLSACLQKVRNYKTEKNQFVFLAEGDCPELRVTVQQLDDKALKFPDPDHNDITRSFERIDENRYQSLVKKSDQRP